MKAKVFIGSSTEGLNIAYSIQQNLEHDCTPTVWTQGIFQLSSIALDDLLVTLENSDFGIFVFTPDDILKIRNQMFSSVRDNVIFELGLFVGKLGKEKVFFIIPKDEENLHLPSDLLGINPGMYDNKREDGNLLAALGPFCNQVRNKFKDFIYQNLNDLQDETKESKRIAIDKPSYWEYLLSGEMLESRLIEINRSYNELDKGLIFQKSKVYTLPEFLQWTETTTSDFTKMIEIFTKIFEQELVAAYGDPGVPGNVLEIKFCVDKIVKVCKELLAWEYELQGIKAPDEANQIIILMKGWTKIFIDEINRFPKLIKNSFSPVNLAKNEPINISLSFTAPPNVNRILELFDQMIENIR